MAETEIREIAVVVPAHNEADLIEACIGGLSESARMLVAQRGSAVRMRIVVVADDCRDGTASLIVDPGIEVITVGSRCVGAARAVGAERVLATTATSLPQLWLANTDADSVVPRRWLCDMVTHAEAGADLVLGTVLPDGERSGREEIARWRRAHTLAEGHPYIHGANLGIRADAYVSLGGWSKLSTGEDVDLVTRARRAELPETRTATMPVQTSSRLRGRAPNGFAGYLSALAAKPALTSKPALASKPLQVTAGSPRPGTSMPAARR